MRKLKQSEIAPTREFMLALQTGNCRLCKLPLPASKAVLDHDHSTGAVRDTIHAGCNSLLGKVENNHKRYGVPNLAAFCHGVASYLQRHETDQHGLLHYTHKTPDEKRVARNTKARKSRALKKVN